MKIEFSESDRELIRDAVEAAERSTSGEIVPYVVNRCGGYEAAVWRGGGLAALSGLAVALVFLRLYEGWGYAWLHTYWGPSAVSLLTGSVGAALVALVPGLKRVLAGSTRLTRNVHGRAVQAFVEEEVFKTRDRTGILLFLSLFERRIEVLGDEGINNAVSADDWVDVVQTIQQGIRSGRVTQGLVEAITKCGKLLAEHGVAIRPDDTDELSNRLRIRSDE